MPLPAPRTPQLQIPNRLALTLPWLEIFLVFENERHEEVNNDRRSNGEEGKIDEVHADSGRADRKFLSPPIAHSECACFKPRGDLIYELVAGHTLQAVGDKGWMQRTAFH